MVLNEWILPTPFFLHLTLVVVIGLLDPLGIGRAALADTKWNGLSTETYLFVALFFFASCFAMSRYSLWLENKLNTMFVFP